MNRATTIDGLCAQLDDVRARAQTIALVPTMGFLHEGHLHLCDAARAHADYVVMSIFVNPLQFGAGEDLDRYPRDMERDTRLAQSRGVDLLFAPDAAAMYPTGDARVRIHAPGLDDRLCGRYRPGHFEGVLTVVAKLFNIVRPDVAVFGQKDLQQALLIRRMAADLDFRTRIVVAPIVREPDGLAMSSRNVYLQPEERTAATALSRALEEAGRLWREGEADPERLVAAARAILDAEPGVATQYVELVDADTLETPGRAIAGNAIAIAAFVGRTRLIDNLILN